MKRCPIGAIVRHDEIRRVMYALQIYIACCSAEVAKAFTHQKLWKKRLHDALSLYKQFRRMLVAKAWN